MTTGLEPATAKNSGPITLHRDVSSDIIEFLPAAAADKLQALRQHVSDLHGLIPDFQMRLDANMARSECANRLARLTGHPHDGGFGLGDDDGRVIGERKRLDAFAKEAARVDAVYQARSAQWTTAGQTLTSVESWLRDGTGNAALEVFEGRAPTLPKGESITDAITRLDQRCREYRADLAKIAAAPIPSAQARAKMRRTIEALARRGEISVSGLVAYNGDISFPTTQVRALVHNVEQSGAVAFVEVCDTAAVTAWLHRDALIAKLDNEISAESDDDAALDADERQRRQSEAQASLLVCERDLAALIWEAQRQGQPIELLSLVTQMRAGAQKMFRTGGSAFSGFAIIYDDPAAFS